MSLSTQVPCPRLRKWQLAFHPPSLAIALLTCISLNQPSLIVSGAHLTERQQVPIAFILLEQKIGSRERRDSRVLSERGQSTPATFPARAKATRRHQSILVQMASCFVPLLSALLASTKLDTVLLIISDGRLPPLYWAPFETKPRVASYREFSSSREPQICRKPVALSSCKVPALLFQLAPPQHLQNTSNLGKSNCC